MRAFSCRCLTVLWTSVLVAVIGLWGCEDTWASNASAFLEGTQPFADEVGEDCMRTEDVCVEAGGTRIVNGVAVTRECWAYRETYACLTPVTESEGENTDGCRTLNADAQNNGPGKCELVADDCAESVTDINGNKTCLKTSESWSCREMIDLPPVNAEWTGHEEEQREIIDESACEDLAKDTTCVKDKLTCTDAGCERTYACGGKETNGCSALQNAGCRITKPAVCVDGSATCGIATGEAVCEGKLPDGVVEVGGAEINDQETVNVGSPTPDASACTSLNTDGWECKQVSQTCVDKYPMTRTINGKKYTAPCWGYERTMACTQTKPVSSCTGLEASPGCSVKDRVCEETDGTGACVKEKVTYACGSQDDVVPGDATLIESSKEETETVEVNTCKSLEENEACRLESKVCTDDSNDAECRHYKLTYICGGGTGEAEVLDDCKALEADASCRKVESQCLGTDAQGNCTMTTVTYECGGQKEDVTVGEICDNSLCIGGVCEGAPAETSKDFLEGLAVMEIARQAGVYGDVAADSLFGGIASSCTTKMAGFSCCRNDVSATKGSISNSAFAVAVTVGVEAAGELIKAYGSPYVYDLLSSHESMSGLLTALYGEAGTGVYSPSFSYYGVTAGWNAGSLTLEFSPMSFMATVALEMASEYFSCTQEDQLHALRSSRGLCHYVGSFCEKTSGLGCLEKKESWVCFNSRLAKTVSIQGRAQLGIGWGTPERPLTRGFTLAEFQALDFSRMDLSAVISEIAQEAAKNGFELNTDAVLKRSEQRVTEASQSGDQYVTVDTITGKEFVGEGNKKSDGKVRMAEMSAGLKWLIHDTLKTSGLMPEAALSSQTTQTTTVTGKLN